MNFIVLYNNWPYFNTIKQEQIPNSIASKWAWLVSHSTTLHSPNTSSEEIEVKDFYPNQVSSLSTPLDYLSIY